MVLSSRCRAGAASSSTHDSTISPATTSSRSTLLTSVPDGLDSVPPDEHRRTCWSWLVKCKRFLVKETGIVDNLSRIASIGYNAIPLVTKETEAHFGNADEHVAVLDSPELDSTKLSNVVLLKAKDAQVFKDHGHICAATGRIRVSTGHGSWVVAVTGRMRANLAFKDKRCRKKRIHTVAKDYEDVEFWILGEGAEAFPHALFVTREFTVKHGLHEPVPRTFVLSRKGLRRSLPELSDHATIRSASARKRAMTMAEAAEQDAKRDFQRRTRN